MKRENFAKRMINIPILSDLQHQNKNWEYNILKEITNDIMVGLSFNDV